MATEAGMLGNASRSKILMHGIDAPDKIAKLKEWQDLLSASLSAPSSKYSEHAPLFDINRKAGTRKYPAYSEGVKKFYQDKRDKTRATMNALGPYTEEETVVLDDQQTRVTKGETKAVEKAEEDQCHFDIRVKPALFTTIENTLDKDSRNMVNEHRDYERANEDHDFLLLLDIIWAAHTHEDQSAETKDDRLNSMYNDLENDNKMQSGTMLITHVTKVSTKLEELCAELKKDGEDIPTFLKDRLFLRTLPEAHHQVLVEMKCSKFIADGDTHLERHKSIANEVTRRLAASVTTRTSLGLPDIPAQPLSKTRGEVAFPADTTSVHVKKCIVCEQLYEKGPRISKTHDTHVCRDLKAIISLKVGDPIPPASTPQRHFSDRAPEGRGGRGRDNGRRGGGRGRFAGRGGGGDRASAHAASSSRSTVSSIDLDCFDFDVNNEDQEYYGTRVSVKGVEAYVVNLRSKVGYDTCASESIMRERRLFNHIERLDTPVKISGVGQGTITATHGGTTPLGWALLCEQCPINLLSHHRARRDGNRITYDDERNEWTMKTPREVFVFKYAKRERMPFTQVEADKAEVHVTKTFTPREIKRATDYRTLHMNLSHPGNASLNDLLGNGGLMNTHLLPRDGDHADTILGPCLGCATAKMRYRETVRDDDVPDVPGKLLHADTVFTPGRTVITSKGKKRSGKGAHLLCVDDKTNMFTIVTLSNESTEAHEIAFDQTKEIYKSNGLNVSMISSDRSATIKACEGHLNNSAITLRQSTPGEHEKTVERGFQTLKGKMRATLASLPFRVHKSLVPKLMQWCTQDTNMMPNSKTGKLSPYNIITGAKPDATLLTSKFGDLGLFYKPGLGDERGQLGIIVGREIKNGSSTVTICPIDSEGKATPTVHRNGRQFVPVAVNDTLINILNRIADDDPLMNDDRIIVSSWSVTMDNENPAKLLEQGATIEQRASARAVLEEISESVTPSQEVPVTRILITPPVAPSRTEDTQEGVDDLTPQPVEPEPTVTRDESTTHGQTTEMPDQGGVNVPDQEATNDSEITTSTRPQRNTRAHVPTSVYGKYYKTEAVHCLSVERIADRMETPTTTKFLNITKAKMDKELRDIGGNLAIREHVFAISTRKLAAMPGGPESMEKEVQQILDQKTWHGRSEESLTKEQRYHAPYANITGKEKASGELKSRVLHDGSNKHYRADREDPKYAQFNTSSPTVKQATVRAIAAIAAHEGRSHAGIDFKGAFINADTPKGIDPTSGKPFKIFIMKLPKIIADIVVKLDPTQKDYQLENGTMFVELDKALYGLIESAMLWYMNLRNALTEIGYKVSDCDKCLFNKTINKSGKSRKITICLHVDDMYVTATDEIMIDDLVRTLEKRYPAGVTTARGLIVTFLGIRFTKNRDGSITMDQDEYVKKLLERHKVVTHATCPQTVNLFEESDEDSPSNTPALYRSKVMELMYLSTMTRPYLQLPINYLSTKCATPTVAHELKLQRVFSYLNSNPTGGVRLKPDEMQVHTFIDASYACHWDAKGQTGIINSIGKTGGFNTAKSQKQKLVTRSTAENELIALGEGLTHSVWLRALLEEQGYKQKPATVYQDNKSTICLAEKGGGNHGRTKHINVRYFYMKQLIDNSEIVLVHLPTDEMVSDMLTKALTGARFHAFRRRVMNEAQSKEKAQIFVTFRDTNATGAESKRNNLKTNPLAKC